MKSAFTLLEICIAVAIIGLLVGIVFAGQSLVRAAQLQNIVDDTQRYLTAVNGFRQKYSALPGDLTNATRYWGSAGGPTHTNDATCQGIASSSTATCDGDGDGKIGDGSNEMFRFWQHLSNAGFIGGSYTGTAIDDGVTAGSNLLGSVPGVNVPKGKIDHTGYSFSYVNTTTGDGATYALNYGNLLWFGAQSGHRTQASAVKPMEAWNLDTKLDDGLPAQGKVIMRSNEQVFGAPNSCTTSASSTDYAGQYRLSNTQVSCALMIETKL